MEDRDKAKAANNAIFLKTCWAMGGRIEVEDLAENAGYTTTVMERLAKLLKTDRTTLVRCVQFYRAYPKGALDAAIMWSHYRYLLPLGTEKERAYHEEKAIKEGWTRDQLAKAINAEEYLSPKDAKKAKKPPRPTSPFFTFRQKSSGWRTGTRSFGFPGVEVADHSARWCGCSCAQGGRRT